LGAEPDAWVRAEPPPAGGLDPKLWKVIGVVMLGPFMAQMDSTVVNVSLSSIREDLHASIAATHWIISGYLLALALMLPINGWLVDRIGAKRLYLVCFSGFTLASLLCGASTTMEGLIRARLLQGIAGGLLAPLTQMMLARAAGRHMARVMGYAAVPVLLAPLLGPILAGAILEYGDWPWLFYVNLPIGLIALAAAAIILPRDAPAGGRRPFDLAGFLLISPGLACLIYGFEQAAHLKGFWFLVPGIVLPLLFIRHAKGKRSAALIDLGLFRIRDFSAGIWTQFLANGITYAGQFLVPLYLTAGCGLTPVQAGWMLAPMGVGMMCVYPLMGYLTDRFGCRAVATAGVAVNFLATLPFLWMAYAGFSSIPAVICLFLRGAGQGATGIPSLSAAYASVPRDQLGSATTAANIVQRLGGPVMTTALAVVMAYAADIHPVQGPRAFVVPFSVLIGFQSIIIAAAARLPDRIGPGMGIPAQQE
jgi:EmrB/QacA subfamily drug resistance transporter